VFDSNEDPIESIAAIFESKTSSTDLEPGLSLL